MTITLLENTAACSLAPWSQASQPQGCQDWVQQAGAWAKRRAGRGTGQDRIGQWLPGGNSSTEKRQTWQREKESNGWREGRNKPISLLLNVGSKAKGFGIPPHSENWPRNGSWHCWGQETSQASGPSAAGRHHQELGALQEDQGLRSCGALWVIPL